MIGADNRDIYHVLWKQKGVLADFTKKIYISQLLKGDRSLWGKVKISTEAQGKSDSSGHGTPWKAQRQLFSPSREKKWKTKALLEAVSSWREKAIFITHLPRRNALLLPMKSVSVLAIVLNVSDDQKMQLISWVLQTHCRVWSWGMA